MPPTPSDVLLYQSSDGQIRLDVQLEHDTVWLTQALMSELSVRERAIITKHLRNIFQSNELNEKAMCKKCIFQLLTALLRFIVWV